MHARKWLLIFRPRTAHTTAEKGTHMRKPAACFLNGRGGRPALHALAVRDGAAAARAAAEKKQKPRATAKEERWNERGDVTRNVVSARTM